MMRAAPFALLVLCAAILFSGYETLGVVDEREARDAAIGHELIERREVLTPVLGGEPVFEKPMVAYATEALGAALTWRSPFGSRLLRGAYAVALVLLTASVAARHFGPRAGWCSAFVLVTTFGLPLAVRTDGTQVLATLLAWAGVQGFSDSLFGRRAGLDFRLVVGWGALAAAFVVGGPLPALWPVAALALYARLARDGEAWRRVHPIAGLGLVAGVALPWYGAMFERHGATFLGHAAFFPYAGAAHAAWYAGPVRSLASLVVGAFPWSTLLPGAALHAAIWWRGARRARLEGDRRPAPPDPAALERGRREESAAHFFVACMAAALIPVALYPVPPLPAVLPALPAVAILCGRLLDLILEDESRDGGHVAWAARMLAVVGTAGAILLSLIATRVHGPAAPELRALAAIVLVASCAPFLAGFIGRRRIAAFLIAAPVALGAPWVGARLLPAMEDYLNARAAATAMESVAPPLAALIVDGDAPPSLRFYSRRNLVERWPLDRALESFRAADGLAYVVFRPANERRVARAARGPLEIVLRSPSLVLARVHPG